MVVQKDFQHYLVSILGYILIGMIAFAAVFPFFTVAMSSLTSESHIVRHGYTVWPVEFSLSAYKLIFQNPAKIMNAYKVSVFITVIGTAISVFVSAMGAYVLYRRDVKYRNYLAFFIYFTTLFNGGLVASYMLILNLGLKNTIWILLLNKMFVVMYVLILRSFIYTSVPSALVEAARIDGCGDFFIFVRIILPLIKPALAAIGLFIALIYWNDWYTAMLYIDKRNLHPLQYTLYQILASTSFAADMVDSNAADAPKETTKLALVMVATGPIVLLYPFLQKYFVSGITIGAVKG